MDQHQEISFQNYQNKITNIMLQLDSLLKKWSGFIPWG